MSAEDRTAPREHRRPGSWSAVVWIGLIAGTLDITDNLIFNHFRGITPTQVFQYIASGLIGAKAFAGDAAPVALGVALHYSIALTWTAIFYWSSRRTPVLTRRSVASGLLYGGFVYLFMNFVVLPLSSVPRPRAPVTTFSRVNGILAVVFFIGLTISLLTRWSDKRRRPHRRRSHNCSPALPAAVMSLRARCRTRSRAPQRGQAGDASSVRQTGPPAYIGPSDFTKPGAVPSRIQAELS